MPASKDNARSRSHQRVVPPSFPGVAKRALDLSQINLNDEFQHALDFIERQGQSVFLTGKAGTGKSTFLHYLREKTAKATVVLAPTGVAALNVGGQTIHYFFLAHVFDELRPYFLELTTIYRQRDETFIRVLNKIREHDLDAELFALLNARVQRTGTGLQESSFITLTTTNEAALRKNQACLDQINTKLYSYPASVTGLFDPATFPTEAVLE